MSQHATTPRHEPLAASLEQQLCRWLQLSETRSLSTGLAEALRLSAFISRHRDALAAQWREFAQTLRPAMKPAAPAPLNDRAEGILAVIARDIGAGPADAVRGDRDPAAAVHGALRYAYGFDILQLGAEFRALRASVPRLWLAHLPREQRGALEELARFHDSVDRALAASLAGYTIESARARDIQLAMLAHDLRSPLCAVSMSGHYLSSAGIVAGKPQLQAVACIQRGAATMDAMIEDLLEYARTHLGRGLPVERSACDMGEICAAALEEMQAAYPDRRFRLHAGGDLGGSFDAARIRRLLANLLSNAVLHGAKDSPVILSAQGVADELVVRVTNFGRRIPAEALDTLFEPLAQARAAGAPGDRRASGLGLGLFIARTIVLGHGGSLGVESSEQAGTVFAARFPRRS